MLPKADRDILLRIRFFLAHAGTQNVSLDGLDPTERGVYRDHRWWTMEELEATTEMVYPARLPEIMRRAAAAGMCD